MRDALSWKSRWKSLWYAWMVATSLVTVIVCTRFSIHFLSGFTIWDSCDLALGWQGHAAIDLSTPIEIITTSPDGSSVRWKFKDVPGTGAIVRVTNSDGHMWSIRKSVSEWEYLRDIEHYFDVELPSEEMYFKSISSLVSSRGTPVDSNERKRAAGALGLPSPNHVRAEVVVEEFLPPR